MMAVDMSCVCAELTDDLRAEVGEVFDRKAVLRGSGISKAWKIDGDGPEAVAQLVDEIQKHPRRAA
jgi:hypothetical protein